MNSETVQKLNGYRQTLKEYKEAGAIKDEALFWSGRMSILVSFMEKESIINLSDTFSLLIACKNEYDTIIFDRVNHVKST